MKGKFDSDALGKFAINHVEKLVLALVLVMFGMLVYSGLSIEPYPVSRSPDNLTSTANSVMTELETDHWVSIQDEEPRFVEVKYEKAVDTNQSIVDPGIDFPLSNYVPPAQTKKRVDPKIDDPQYAPQKIEVYGQIGAFSYVAGKNKDPYASLKDAPKMKVEVEKKKRPSKSRRNSRGNSGSSMSDFGAMSMTMSPADLGGSSPESPMGMGMSGEAGFSATTKGRRLDKKYAKGFPGAPTGTVAVTQQFIAGSAVMPNAELDAEFLKALQNSKSFDVRRDRPRYLAFKVIRADVTDRSVDELEEPDDAKIRAGQGDWVETTNNGYMDDAHLRYWQGALGEVIPSDYIDDLLTTPLPPLMLQEATDFASHSLIDAAIAAESDGAGAEEEVVEEGPVANAGPMGDDLDASMLSRTRRSFKNRSSGSSSASGGSAGMSMSMDMEEEGDEQGSSMESMLGMAAMGMAAGGGSRNTIVVPAADYKLIRFYDFREPVSKNKYSPQPGRKYVYRIRVAIEDPNYPVSVQNAPPLKTLSAEVLKRVVEQSQADQAKAQKLSRPGLRTGYIWSSWSEPSPPVSLPPMRWYAAGEVNPGGMQTMGGKTFPSVKQPASANLVAVNWDWRYATERTAEFKDAPLGTPLNSLDFTDEIVNPTTMGIKSLPGATVVTDGVLLDVEGGQPLAASSEELPMSAPGMMLLFDERGGLRVHNEVEDAMDYRKYTFEDEREAAVKAAESATTLMTEDEEDMGDSIFEDFE